MMGLPARLAVGGAGLGAMSILLAGWLGGMPLTGAGAAVGGVAVAFAAASGWLAGRWITRRLEPIIRFAQQIPEGAVRVPAPTSDHIGRLAGALNETAERINRRIASIAEDRARFEAVLAGMVEGMVVLDHAGRILLINAAMERILACRSEEIVGHKWIEVIRDHPLNELINRVLIDRAARTGEFVRDEAAGPRVFAVQASVSGSRAAPKEGFRAVFVFHDVTALKRLERVRTDFVANVSHELRTPLTSVAGYLEALLDGAQHDPTQRDEFLRIMKTHTDRLNALVNDLLQLSQIESGAYRWRHDHVDAVALVRRAVALVGPMAEKKRMTITTGSRLPAHELVGDAEKLTQVLVNLLDNAVKYTGEGGTVDVRVDQGEGGVTIAVTDSGVGIPDTDRARIFERFYRVDRARSRQLGGTGLGLSIVKHIVDAHKGTVTVDSRLGRGSTFTVTLPTSPGSDIQEELSQKTVPIPQVGRAGREERYFPF